MGAPTTILQYDGCSISATGSTSSPFQFQVTRTGFNGDIQNTVALTYAITGSGTDPVIA